MSSARIKTAGFQHSIDSDRVTSDDVLSVLDEIDDILTDLKQKLIANRHAVKIAFSSHKTVPLIDGPNLLCPDIVTIQSMADAATDGDTSFIIKEGVAIKTHRPI